MSEFTASYIVDGDTFRIKGNWEWDGQKGNTIRPAGYNTPEKYKPGYAQAKKKLKGLILGKTIRIQHWRTVDKWGRLIADVYYKDKHLADYFPEHK